MVMMKSLHYVQNLQILKWKHCLLTLALGVLILLLIPKYSDDYVPRSTLEKQNNSLEHAFFLSYWETGTQGQLNSLAPTLSH